MPILVVLPGIAAYVLYQNGEIHSQMLTNGELREDNAYAAILKFLPTGLRGLSMAALTAAIVASLAGKANSISTIFSLDIYKKYFNKNTPDKKLVQVGRIAIFISLIIAVMVNWNDILGIGSKGGFEFIQKYTGYISPAIFPVFLLGFFWKKATAKGAIAGIFCGVILAILFDKILPNLFGNSTWLYTAYNNGSGHFEIPFLVQMGWVFFITFCIIIIVSLLDFKGRLKVNSLEIDKTMFKIQPTHMAIIAVIILLVVALYAKFW